MMRWPRLSLSTMTLLGTPGTQQNLINIEALGLTSLQGNMFDHYFSEEDLESDL